MTETRTRWVNVTTFIQGDLDTDQHVRTKVCERINEVLDHGGEIVAVAESQEPRICPLTNKLRGLLTISVYYKKIGDKVPEPAEYIKQQENLHKGPHSP